MPTPSSAPSYIRRHINNLADDKPFSIRDFLIYGPRNIVDQVFHRLVQKERIIRVARGVYIKSTSPLPSMLEVARVKAAAFGRTIVTHGSKAAQRLLDKTKAVRPPLVFATSGASSSFRVGNQVIYMIRTSARKMGLGDSRVGLALRALWHLGEMACVVDSAARMVAPFQKDDHRTLRLSAALMPAWMRDCFARFGRMDCRMNDLKAKAPRFFEPTFGGAT